MCGACSRARARARVCVCVCVCVYVCVRAWAHVYACVCFFNRDARNLLDHSSHVVKVTSVKFVVNCLVVYGKSPEIESHSVEQRAQIIKFIIKISARETFRALP